MHQEWVFYRFVGDMLLPYVLESYFGTESCSAGPVAVMMHQFEILQPAFGVCSWSRDIACLAAAVSKYILGLEYACLRTLAGDAGYSKLHCSCLRTQLAHGVLSSH